MKKKSRKAAARPMPDEDRIYMDMQANRTRIEALEREAATQLIRIAELQADLDRLKVAWASLRPDATNTEILAVIRRAWAQITPAPK
jgi:predicted RNase H-like nuclease (RuvC/YqgF family)